MTVSAEAIYDSLAGIDKRFVRKVESVEIIQPTADEWRQYEEGTRMLDALRANPLYEHRAVPRLKGKAMPVIDQDTRWATDEFEMKAQTVRLAHADLDTLIAIRGVSRLPFDVPVSGDAFVLLRPALLRETKR